MSRRRQSSWVARAACGGLAAILFALGIPQTAASFLRLYGGDGYDLSHSQIPTSVDTLRTNIGILEADDDWLDDPQARIRAGFLHLSLATAQSANAVDRDGLQEAAADLASGLRRAPGDAVAWSALAEAEIDLGDRASAARALRTSLLLAFHDPQLALARVDLGLRLWPGLTDEDRQMLNEQVAMAWDRQPRDLVALAKRSGWVILITALGADPARQMAFAKALHESR